MQQPYYANLVALQVKFMITRACVFQMVASHHAAHEMADELIRNNLQDKTEILEVHVPQGGLSMVQDICNNNDGQEKNNAPVFLTQEESMGIRDVLNADQRTAAAQNWYRVFCATARVRTVELCVRAPVRLQGCFWGERIVGRQYVQQANPVCERDSSRLFALMCVFVCFCASFTAYQEPFTLCMHMRGK
jgi:hypothetical protein